MSAEEVADVVLFAVNQPRNLRMMTVAVPADERGLVGLRLGLLSTAHINEKLVAGARLVDEVDVVAVASRDLGRAERAGARSWASSGRSAPTRRCSRTPTSTRSTSRCPTRCTSTGRSARSRRASTCSARSRWRAPSEPVERAFDAAEQRRPRAGRGVHVAPPPAGRSGSSSCCRAWASCARCARSSRSRSTRDAAGDDIRLSGELEGGALMDVGCYCVSGARLVAGRADRGDRRAGDRRRRRGRALHRHAAAAPATCWRTSTAASTPPTAAALEVVGSEGVPAAARPLALARAGDRAARGRRLGRSGSRPSAPTRTPASCATSPPRRRASASRCSAARTRSARRARSPRCTRAPRAATGRV